MTDLKYELSKVILKKSALQNRSWEELTDDEIKEKFEEQENPLLVLNKLTDNEMEELMQEINNPLLHLYYGGYREYINEKGWICLLCGKKIDRHKGYWGCREMRWSVGVKLCHKCFLKFLLMIEDNEYLMLLFEKIRGKELEILSPDFKIDNR